MPSHIRHELIHQHWGFTCACSLCNSSPSYLAASDSRRTSIVELIHHVQDLLMPAQGDPTAKQVREAIKTTNKVLKLLEKEELLTQFAAGQYDLLARSHWALGEGGKAREYARMVVRDRYDDGEERRRDMWEILGAEG